MEGRDNDNNDMEEIKSMMQQLADRLARIETRNLNEESFDGEQEDNPFHHRAPLEEREEITWNDHAESLVIQRVMNAGKAEDDPNWLRYNIFHTKRTASGKVCHVIIDGDNRENIGSQDMVDKLNLKTKRRRKSYKLSWTKKGNDVNFKKVTWCGEIKGMSGFPVENMTSCMIVVKHLTRLTGQGTVELTNEKSDGSTFSPEAGGEQRKTATIQVVLDGYSAPLTAGNFTKLVIDGAYDGARLSRTDQAVLTENGLDKIGYNIPLEIMPSGQFEPLYRTTLSVQDGELPVLPLSVYGVVAMAHSEDSEDYSAPYQIFFYLYDKRNAGLGELSFDEGQFSVFGYIFKSLVLLLLVVITHKNSNILGVESTTFGFDLLLENSHELGDLTSVQGSKTT
ncbi:hypothetical protein EZV62_008377 [Acer yangbiense]|uniref:PPIase cyclophilin-type domain-containing protein n=1 Tax=Acer yangbiense TaxID=1000413 RepID=A0A5C7IDX6_9ROSI|nr:hypothetical protein EZV62_008377 [Acer yangbiense]